LPSIEFPLLSKITPLGSITDPRIDLQIATPFGWQDHRFLIDTGADFSAVPRWIAELAAPNWEALTPARISDVGAGIVEVRVGNLPIRIGDAELPVRCMFVDRPDAPLVLGRGDVLERFVITFDAGRQRITFEEIRA
jgi:predicted aspartyl protease